MVSETLASWKIVKNGVIGIGMKFFAQWNFHALSVPPSQLLRVFPSQSSLSIKHLLFSSASSLFFFWSLSPLKVGLKVPVLSNHLSLR